MGREKYTNIHKKQIMTVLCQGLKTKEIQYKENITDSFQETEVRTFQVPERRHRE